MPRKLKNSINRQSLTWNPQGKRSVGHPRVTWKHELDGALKNACQTWNDLIE